MVREIAIGAAGQGAPQNHMIAANVGGGATMTLGATAPASHSSTNVQHRVAEDADDEDLLARTKSEEEQVIADDLTGLVVDDEKFMQT